MIQQEEEYRSFGEPFESHEVSNFGNVRRKLKNGTYRPLKGSVCQTYLRVCVSNKNNVCCFFIHHLVARAFIGKRPTGLVIDHIDRNRLNNHASNLRYTTYRENKKNSDTFKGYITERPTTKEDTSRFRVDIRRDGERYKKTFKTREEAEVWVNSEEYTDAVKNGKQGEGYIHKYESVVDKNQKYRGMTRIKGKLYTKVFESEKDAQDWIYHIRGLDHEALPQSSKRPKGTGNITVRKTKNGDIKYDAKMKRNGKQIAKTFSNSEEASTWLDSLI